MENKQLDEQFWSTLYESGNTPWDIGQVSTPLKKYFDQLQDKEIKILIPGVGRGYEAEYLYSHNFKNVFVVDIAEAPLKELKNRLPAMAESQIIHTDFFNLEDQFDLIVEQTFLSALHPSLREKYVKKVHDLLKKGGKLVGLLFKFPLTENGPPYGGSKREYQELFQVYFNIKLMEEAHNSIKPRMGNELFIKLEKK